MINENILSVVGVQASDRYIYIERDADGRLLGINYMQGLCDTGLQQFKSGGYMEADKELTDFILDRAKICTIEEIDDLIWKKHKLDCREIEECCYCSKECEIDDIQPLGDNDDARLICTKCDDTKLERIKSRLEDAINEVFVFSLTEYGATSGDITPEQVDLLDSLQAQLFDLILEHTEQNL